MPLSILLPPFQTTMTLKFHIPVNAVEDCLYGSGPATVALPHPGRARQLLVITLETVQICTGGTSEFLLLITYFDPCHKLKKAWI